MWVWKTWHISQNIWFILFWGLAVWWALCYTYFIRWGKGPSQLVFLGCSMTSISSVFSFSCSCCGRSIIKPAFIEGKAYGQDCAKKIKGTSFVKSKAVFVTAEQVSIDMESYLPSATYKIKGIPQTFKTNAPFPAHVIVQKGTCLEDYLPKSAIMVINHEGKPVFKSLTVSLKDGVIVYTDKYGKQTIVSA